MSEKNPAEKHEAWLNRTAHARIRMQAFDGSPAGPCLLDQM